MIDWLMDKKCHQAGIILAATLILVVTAFGLVESVQATQITFEVLLIILLVAPAVCLPAMAFRTHAQEKERADAIIQMQNRNLSVVLENMSQGLCMYDGEGRLTVCNELYAFMYGLTPEMVVPGTLHTDVVRRRMEAGVYGDDLDQDFIAKREKWVRKPTFVNMTETLADGRVFNVTIQPLPNGGWVSTHADITERKQAEEEIIRHRDHLQEMVDAATLDLKLKAQELESALAKEKELNELQREFISMASHEFRTPLAIIDSSAQRLRKQSDLSQEHVLKRTDKIRKAVSRMTRLMESTLAAARMEKGKIAIKLGTCRIRDLLTEVCERQRDLSPSHNISCDLGDLPDSIRADSDALEQVFTNLLSNAVKYSPDAPDISVEAKLHGSDVTIAVKDDGIGIDADDLPRVGERFFRAKSSVGIAGTGIGLNLACALINQHEGGIDVTSEEKNGCTFTVRLPVEGPQSVAKDGNTAVSDAA